MVAEEQAIIQREQDEWNQKVVVDNQHFKVNTKILESQQLDKYKGLREEGVKKIGFRLGPQKVKSLQQRQIQATKNTPMPPISALALEEFVEDRATKPQKPLLPDWKKTPLRKDGTRSEMNFQRHTRQGVTINRATSTKVFINPVHASEKKGPKWNPSNSAVAL